MSTVKFKVTNSACVSGKYSAATMRALFLVSWSELNDLAMLSLDRQVECISQAAKYKIDGRWEESELWIEAWKLERVAFFHIALALGSEIPDGALVG